MGSPCDSQPSTMCGGEWRNSIFQHGQACYDRRPGGASWNDFTWCENNTDNCAARRAGTNNDGYCAKTCGVCQAGCFEEQVFYWPFMSEINATDEASASACQARCLAVAGCQ